MELKTIKGQQLSALIVEDEEKLRDILIHMLQSLEVFGFIVGAVDGKEALMKLANQKFDIILTDLKMPRLGGLDLIRQIRRLNPADETKIMLMSGALSVEDVKEAKELGVTSVLAKPFDVERFKSVLLKNKIVTAKPSKKN